MMKLNELAKSHHQWLETKGWNNTTPLESAGMIGSEIGEAVRECYRDQISVHFKEEIADILLRIIGLTQRYNLDLDQALIDEEDLFQAWVIESGYGKGSVLADLALMTGEWAKIVNECRGTVIGENFAETVAKVIWAIFDLSKRTNMNIEQELTAKIDKNLKKVHTRLK